MNSTPYFRQGGGKNDREPPIFRQLPVVFESVYPRKTQAASFHANFSRADRGDG